MSEHADELIDAYALGALDADETARVQAHLAMCARCRELLAASRGTVSALLYTAPQVEPPPVLRSKILARIHTLPAQAPEARDATPAARVRQLLRQWLGEQSDPAGDPAVTLLRRLMRSPQVQTWDVAGTDDAPVAFAHLVGTPRGKNAVLVTAGLDSLASDRDYQIWLLRDGKPLPNALFHVDRSGRTRQIVRAPMPLGRFDVVAVTPEPSGGSPAPTGPIVLMGQISA